MKKKEQSALNLTLKIKLLPSIEQRFALFSTIKEFNSMCNISSSYSFSNKVKNKDDIQDALYASLIKNSSNGSQLLIRAFAKVASSYKDFDTKRAYQELGAIDYDKRCMSFKPKTKRISLKVSGVYIEAKEKYAQARIEIPYAHTRYIDNILLTRKTGQGKLSYEKHTDAFYYLLSYKEIEEKPIVSENYLGVDRGVTNIATLSNRDVFSAKLAKKFVAKFSKSKSDLQKIKSSSSRQKLKQKGKRHSAFIKDSNHCISKKIVGTAKALGFSISLEDLSSMKEKKNKSKGTVNSIPGASFNFTTTKKFRKGIAGWSYYQLEFFIKYKAQRSGVGVKSVNARYTSQECSQCSHIESDNRKVEAFKCLDCGHKDHSDINAAKTISKRATIDADDRILLSANKPKIMAHLRPLYLRAGHVIQPNGELISVPQCDVMGSIADEVPVTSSVL